MLRIRIQINLDLWIRIRIRVKYRDLERVKCIRIRTPYQDPERVKWDPDSDSIAGSRMSEMINNIYNSFMFRRDGQV